MGLWITFGLGLLTGGVGATMVTARWLRLRAHEAFLVAEIDRLESEAAAPVEPPAPEPDWPDS
jgi:hypothetical protein